MRQAFAGMLWSKQFYHYDVARWLDGDPAEPAPAAGAPTRAQRAVAAPLQPRRHLDAGQVGVPLVRGLGPGVPLRGARPRRPGVRQGAAASCCTREWYMHPNGQLPAYEWDFGDVNPPVHALGGAAGVRARRRARLRVPRAHLPQAAAELHLVGQPQGHRRRQRLRGRLPRPGQHRARSTAPRRCPTATCWSRPTAPAGWRCTASTCSRSRWSWPSTTRPTRTSRSSSSSTSATSRGRSTRPGCGTRRTASTTTRSAAPPTAAHWPVRARSMVGLIPLYAVARGDGRVMRELAEFPRRVDGLPARAAAPRAGRQHRPGGRRSEHPAGPGRPGPAAAAARAPGATRRSSCRRTGCAPCRPPTGATRSSCGRTGGSWPRSTTSRPSRRPALFGGNSNWRGPVWFPVNVPPDRPRCSRYHHYFGDGYTRRVPDAARARDARCARSPHDLGRGSSRSSCPTRDGRRPVLRRRRALPAPTRHGATTCCSTSTSTATTAPGSAPPTRPAGPAWSPNLIIHQASLREQPEP